MIVRDFMTGRSVQLRRRGNHLSLAPSDRPPEQELCLTRGWIDIQVNGFAGYDVNTPGMTPETFEDMTLRLHAVGVTQFLPTVITQSVEHMTRCLRAVVDACRASSLVRNAVAGIHLEGPFISPEEGARGAHPQEHVVPPDIDTFDELQLAAEGTIRLVTLAPERPGAIPFIQYLRSRGIVVALGHTNADAEVLRAAVDAGASLSTHLGNGAPAMLPRHPNMIWEQLAEPRLTASCIFDGHHLPSSVMRVIYRVKGAERMILTSDAVALAGMPPGIYEGQVGGRVELHPSGRLTLYGTPYLAGSASSLLNGVRTALAVDIPFEEAITMVTRTPAQLLGLSERNSWALVYLGETEVDLMMSVVEDEIVYESELLDIG